MMTLKEKIQDILQKCFHAPERELLFRDASFKVQFEAAETPDDLEAVAKRGAILLFEAEFPGDPKTPPPHIYDKSQSRH